VKIIRNIAACIALASLWHAEALALDPAKALTPAQLDPPREDCIA
jgi:hypothetical protein